jgi:hypothetical protein
MRFFHALTSRRIPVERTSIFGVAVYTESMTNNLLPSIKDMQSNIKRILLVDYDRTEYSTDAFRQAFLYSTIVYSRINVKTMAETMEIADNYKRISMELFNLLDWAYNKANPNANPKTIATSPLKVWGRLSTGNRVEYAVENFLKKGKYSRVIPTYPPKLWELPIKDTWRSAEERANALKMQRTYRNTIPSTVVCSPPSGLLNPNLKSMPRYVRRCTGL